jgi:hypothetical protein
MGEVIHICGYCRKSVATVEVYDEITNFTTHFCEKCKIEDNEQARLFWASLGFEIE